MSVELVQRLSVPFHQLLPVRLHVPLPSNVDPLPLLSHVYVAAAAGRAANEIAASAANAKIERFS